MTNIHSIDLTLAQGYLDNLGKQVVQKMLDLYIQQSVVYIDDINASLDSKVQEQWHERCHKMKGAAGSVGLIDVHAHLVAIEKISGEWDVKRTHLVRLTNLNSDAISQFKQWLDTV